MYLVHVQLSGPGDATFPDVPARDVLALAVPGDGIEHVSMHPLAKPHPTLGIWVLAASMPGAEIWASAFTLRLLHQHALFGKWTVVRAAAPSLAPLVRGPLRPPGSALHTPEPDQRWSR
ncbi:hypothetical protein [Streptomyces cadmiisoli]|uniref:hypothetical protein n=1 Tax=Streptomyces cadmiisoli TaxID=2184053 RepID=UPI00366976E2